MLISDADDPYKTVIGGSADIDDDENLLQLPTDAEHLDRTSSMRQYEQADDLLFDSPTEQFAAPFESNDYQAPSPVFDEPSFVKESGLPYENPPAAFNESPFEQYQNPPAQQQVQTQWSPPSVPEAAWQNQSAGAPAVVQPPLVKSQNQTLPIISLVCGVLGLVAVCCYGGIPLGIAAMITGYLAIQNINKDSMNFTGKGLAIAGMILGGVAFIINILFILGFAARSFVR